MREAVVGGMLLLIGLGKATLAQPPEQLAQLQCAVGSWKEESVFHESVWHPTEVRIQGTIERKWILNKHVLQETGRSAQVETHILWTFDPEKKAFRATYFDSFGGKNDWTGVWTAKDKTMRWTASLPNGLSGTSTQRFLDDGTSTVHTLVKDADGKVDLNMESKHTPITR